MIDWPFNDPPNTAVLTTGDVLAGNAAVLLVTHDADDGSWQFLPGRAVAPEDARIVGLGRMCTRDPSLRELADLPEGWQATRDRSDGPWHRQPASDARSGPAESG